MIKCAHASFCGKRMAEGDRANGCDSVDQAQCNPVIGSSPTAAPAANVRSPIWLSKDDGDKPR